MDDSALKIALRKLLDQGEAAEDAKMIRMANAKKGSPALANAECPECKGGMENGKCAKCGYEAESASEDEGELADLLEQG